MKGFSHWFPILLLVSGLLLSACAPRSASPAPSPTPSPSSPVPGASQSAPQTGAWDIVLASARKEGTLTVYNVLGVELSDALKAGMKQYGVNVETIGGSGGELEQKIKTEQRAKSYYADALITGFTNNLAIVEAGYAQPIAVTLPSLADPSVWKVDPSKYEATKSVFVYSTGITISVIANTDLVRKGEIQSWQDLLDPKWRDRMVMTDPRQGSGPATSGIWIWGPILGEDFWKKLAAQRVSMQVSYDVPVNQAAFGEKALAIFPASSRTVSGIKAGAPIQILHMKEGTSHNVRAVGIIKNAPHPNAALVLVNWMLSREGQVAIGRATDNFALRKDVTENWLRIPELRIDSFTLVDPPNNIDLEGPRKGTEFAKRIFGER